jgi:hypothetical protein
VEQVAEKMVVVVVVVLVQFLLYIPIIMNKTFFVSFFYKTVRFESW